MATNPAFLPDLAMALNNLGNVYSNVGRRQEAVEPTEESIKINRELAATNSAFLGYQAANLWYGKLGKSLGLALGTTPDCTYDDGTPIWTFILAEGWRIGYEDEWEWRMRPELATALEMLGSVK